MTTLCVPIKLVVEQALIDLTDSVWILGLCFKRAARDGILKGPLLRCRWCARNQFK